jgi:methanol--5-hydroxybenzimidazolylcobamide Co-methyltransferase
MNQSLADGQDAARQLQRWLVRSDAPLDPQAYILTPSSAVRLARRIVQSPDDYTAGRAVALEAIDLLEEGAAAGELMIAERERPWLAIMRQSVEALPDDEDAFIERTMSSLDPTRYKPIEYDLQLTLC